MAVISDRRHHVVELFQFGEQTSIVQWRTKHKHVRIYDYMIAAVLLSKLPFQCEELIRSGFCALESNARTHELLTNDVEILFHHTLISVSILPVFHKADAL